jgi:hypothetical protein
MKTKFEIWLENVNTELETEWNNNFTHKAWTPILPNKGSKFIKMMHGTTVWGFVSMVDGEHLGAPIKKGDLMKPASWRAAAKHSRGNIFDGTAKYGMYGPKYL